MILERAAFVTMAHAIPWAPIVLGFSEGLQRAGVDNRIFDAAPSWFQAEQVRRFAPQVVLFALHRDMREHLPAWRSELPADIPFVALCFDDPYDMTTSLSAGHHFDLILTPEACAVDTYASRGRKADWLLPTVCDLWHEPPQHRGDYVHDVLSVGGNQWHPRRTWIPHLVKALRARNKVFGEVAGQSRWIVGRQLTAAMHRARLTFDLPRTEYTSDNPLRVPCTYVGPRAHIAAACGIPCILLEARGQADATYPASPCLSIDDPGCIDAIVALIDNDDERNRIAEACRSAFMTKHSPAVRGLYLLDLLRRWLDFA